MARRTRRFTYGSLLALATAACGGTLGVEALSSERTAPETQGSDAALASEASSSTIPSADDAGEDAIVEASLDAGSGAMGCPPPGDPRWAAHEVDAACGILESGGCTSYVTPALACAMLANPEVCAMYKVCDALYKGCGVADYDYTSSYYQADAACPEATDAAIRVTCCQAGRRPDRLLPREGSELDVVASWLADCAWLEAASVVAFEDLAAELGALGAPSTLVEGCLAAAREERTHARLVGAVARARGASLTPPEVLPRAPRSLFDLALENVREGCVKETFAATVAVVQSKHAPEELRAMLTTIATDEASHADLAHRIDAWARSLLGPEANAALDEARTRTFAELRASHVHVPPVLTRELGIPDARRTQRLIDALEAA